MKDIVGRKTRDRRRSALAVDPVGTGGDPEPIAPLRSQYPHTIGLRLGDDLYATAENAIEGAHLAGDYSLTSLPELIRAALTAHFSGMALTAPPESGKKRRTTIGLDDELKLRYDKLPNRKRGEIVERALRTFLNRGMGPL